MKFINAVTLLSGNKTRIYQEVLRVLNTNPLDVHLDLLYKQWHVPLEPMLVYVHIILDSSCAGMKTTPDKGLLFTHKNGDFGTISVMEQRLESGASQ